MPAANLFRGEPKVTAKRAREGLMRPVPDQQGNVENAWSASL